MFGIPRPATFYGFASTFAYLSVAPAASTMGALTMFGWNNVLVAVPISLLTGTGLGIMHGWLAKFLATAGPKAVPGHPARLGGKS